MKILVILLVAVFVSLQYKLWIGESNVFQSAHLKNKIAEQEKANTILFSQNKALEADIIELKSGDQALEEQARYGLGMVKEGELFYQFTD